MPDNEIDYSDIPELGDEFFKNVRLVQSLPKQQVTIPFDGDVVESLIQKSFNYNSALPIAA